jgi:hypothetical protein
MPEMGNLKRHHRDTANGRSGERSHVLADRSLPFSLMPASMLLA